MELRAWRIRKVLTQRDLAEKAGVATVTVAAIERGIQLPSSSTSRKLAGALEVKPTDIVEVRQSMSRALSEEEASANFIRIDLILACELILLGIQEPETFGDLKPSAKVLENAVAKARYAAANGTDDEATVAAVGLGNLISGFMGYFEDKRQNQLQGAE